MQSMKIGMTMPVMEYDLNRQVLRDWAQTIDQGPWDSLAFGERMVFPNPDASVLMGACSAWTQRVEIIVTIFVAALHNPVMLAKQIATADMLSEGRLKVGFGIGGREEDYRAAGADLANRKNADIARRVAQMRQVWAGEHVVEGVERPVGPPCFTAGGPPLLAGAMGPKAIALAAQWANGVCGMSFGPDPQEIAANFAMVSEAWAQASRPKPQLGTSFWFAVGDDARARVEAHLKRYFTWVSAAERDAIAGMAGFAGSAQELKDMIARIEDAGTDELLLIPTSKDLDQVHRVADVIG
jgi:alkanesulfonate monooxygenase SsuD/methylene tetrahydromethanopterin reductase-like flavin-dependent oxidoreductase (luciferase family)